MANKSAGLLPYRYRNGVLQVFLVHPGGPLWAKKDFGAWSIAKGEFVPEEDPLAAAKREFQEETGFMAGGELRPLAPRKQSSGKVVEAWFFEADYDAAAVRSNTFSMEWPPRSGKKRDFPEVDRAAWFTLDEAKKRILKGQAGFLEEVQRRLGKSG